MQRSAFCFSLSFAFFFHRRFFLPAFVVFLADLPPANSAFSVLRARCFACVALRAAFVSYRTFFFVVAFFFLLVPFPPSTSLAHSPPFWLTLRRGEDGDSACGSEEVEP